MPAVVSSAIPPVLDQLCGQPGAAEDELPALLARLAEVPDPRKPRGRRHSLVYVPAPAAWAVLTGASSLPAISKWATDAPPVVLDRLGARRCPLSGTRPVPCERTIRRTQSGGSSSLEPRTTVPVVSASRKDSDSRAPAARHEPARAQRAGQGRRDSRGAALMRPRRTARGSREGRDAKPRVTNSKTRSPAARRDVWSRTARQAVVRTSADEITEGWPSRTRTTGRHRPAGPLMLRAAPTAAPSADYEPMRAPRNNHGAMPSPPSSGKAPPPRWDCTGRTDA